VALGVSQLTADDFMRRTALEHSLFERVGGIEQ
jgi:hypothetical protein